MATDNTATQGKIAAVRNVREIVADIEQAAVSYQEAITATGAKHRGFFALLRELNDATGKDLRLSLEAPISIIFQNAGMGQLLACKIQGQAASLREVVSHLLRRSGISRE